MMMRRMRRRMRRMSRMRRKMKSRKRRRRRSRNRMRRMRMRRMRRRMSRMRMRMREDGGDEGSVGGGNFKIFFQLNFRTREVKQTFSEEKKNNTFSASRYKHAN